MDSIEELPPREDSLSHQSPTPDRPSPDLRRNQNPRTPPHPDSPTHSDPTPLPTQPHSQPSPTPNPTPTYSSIKPDTEPKPTPTKPEPIIRSQSPDTAPDTQRPIKSTVGEQSFRPEMSNSPLNRTRSKGQLASKQGKNVT